jgi:tRNA 2-thiocytidine biosynthesis protein TtcA
VVNANTDLHFIRISTEADMNSDPIDTQPETDSSTLDPIVPVSTKPDAPRSGHEAALRAKREANKLEKRLCRQMGQAIIDFNMIEEGDRVMVCISGGKDSFGLLDILLKLQKRAPVHFDIIAVNLDQKQPGFPAHILPDYLGKLGIEYHIETQDTYSIVKKVVPEGKTMCSLCSRLRRGILYGVADRLKINKIALGHHRDDMLHTFFLNMFFAGKLKGMPPKLVSDDGHHMVIRPLAYVNEKDLIAWAAHRGFPIIPCSLCGSQENLQRQEIKRMMHQWERQYPGRTETMFTALQNVVPSHLMDAQRFDFKNIQLTGQADNEGDKAFDDEEMPTSSFVGLPVMSGNF